MAYVELIDRPEPEEFKVELSQESKKVVEESKAAE